MKEILYLDWPHFGAHDMIPALEAYFQRPVILFNHKDYKERKSDDFQKCFDDMADSHDISFCFSYNYYPLLAEACHRHDIKYLSLVYDSPFVKLYSFTIAYPTNYVFLFDYSLYLELKNGGINTVYYTPLPVNAAGLEQITCALPQELLRTTSDVSFVGALYNEEHNIFDRMYEKLDDAAKGFLDGIMDAQLQITGYNFIEEVLNQSIIDAMHKAEPYEPYFDGAETLSYVYANYYIDRKLTSMERIRLLSSTASRFCLKLFTLDSSAVIPGASNMGPADYLHEMPLVFANSKINLNITLRSIKSGIPLRAMDILGAGGFLLTNYQEDMLRHFIPGTDFDYYEDESDLLHKIDYYLTHEEIRKEIAANGHAKVKANHSFHHCIQEMASQSRLEI